MTRSHSGDEETRKRPLDYDGHPSKRSNVDSGSKCDTLHLCILENRMLVLFFNGNCHCQDQSHYYNRSTTHTHTSTQHLTW